MTAPVSLFVYGTLLPDFDGPMALVLRRESARLGSAWAPGRLYDSGEYPIAMFEAAENLKVHGELLRLARPEHTLAWLDAYEGYDPVRPLESLFIRSEITVWQNEIPHLCFAYQAALPPAGLPLVAGGDYLAQLRAHQRGGPGL